MGFVMPKQYCQAVMKDSNAGFWVIILGRKVKTSMFLYYSVLPYCMVTHFAYILIYSTGLPIPIVAVSAGLSHKNYGIKDSDGSLTA